VKLKKKGLDLIAANDVSREDAGFGVDQNRVTLIWPDGRTKDLGLLPKYKIAVAIIKESVDLLN
jgi:phosphopantothenoylcysteine decarboxylase/phosphopantothenate--cysteine ligase